MSKMPDNAPPSARNNPVVFTFLITAALAAAVLSGAAFSGAASGAMRDLLRTAGFGRTGEVVEEQRRHAETLERIELAVGRVRADIALLNARIDEVRKLNRDAGNGTSVNPVSGHPAPGYLSQSHLGQSHPPQSGPEFDLGALRASLDADAATPGVRTSRPHPRRTAKGGRDV
jgi:hypothetical protein